jgi:hypothetical protein
MAGWAVAVKLTTLLKFLEVARDTAGIIGKTLGAQWKTEPIDPS